MHHGDHARLQAGPLGGGDHEVAHDLPASSTELAEELSVVKKAGPQDLRDGEGPGEDRVLNGATPEAVVAFEPLFPRALDLAVAALDELIEG